MRGPQTDEHETCQMMMPAAAADESPDDQALDALCRRCLRASQPAHCAKQVGNAGHAPTSYAISDNVAGTRLLPLLHDRHRVRTEKRIFESRQFRPSRRTPPTG
jgi:hypothetical protein